MNPVLSSYNAPSTFKCGATRLWRTVKYEEIYLHDYESVFALEAGLERYFNFYNAERTHKSLGYCTPAEVYLKGCSAARFPIDDPP